VTEGVRESVCVSDGVRDAEGVCDLVTDGEPDCVCVVEGVAAWLVVCVRVFEDDGVCVCVAEGDAVTDRVCVIEGVSDCEGVACDPARAMPAIRMTSDRNAALEERSANVRGMAARDSRSSATLHERAIF
jgi:hypothetical protein